MNLATLRRGDEVRITVRDSRPLGHVHGVDLDAGLAWVTETNATRAWPYQDNEIESTGAPAGLRPEVSPL